MVQGTGSDVGKSLIVAGLARAYARRGLRVRPFKPQNMSNNAAVTSDGGEIGRAQALQAQAAGVPPSVHMNPVLLKPKPGGAQVIVQGRLWQTIAAHDYQSRRTVLLPKVLESFAHLAADADLVLVEGAGSASEVNLRAADLANMGFAGAAGVPVVLVGDIERGGVIASLVGTQAVLPPGDAARIIGYIVNKFHGDPALFAGGRDLISARTGWPCFGILPFFPEARLFPPEDLTSQEEPSAPPAAGAMRIAVSLLPGAANLDDLDGLRADPAVHLTLVRPGSALPGDADLILLPGSKATLADLATFRQAGFDIDLRAHVRRGGRVLGLCGGYQMLGRWISDPDGLEAPPGSVDGLGLLDVETVLRGPKTLRQVAGRSFDGAELAGYEIHLGRTIGPDTARPFALLTDGTADGARDAGGQVFGTYLHGLFAGDAVRSAWLRRLGGVDSAVRMEGLVESLLDRWADHLTRHLDLDGLLAAALPLTLPRR